MLFPRESETREIRDISGIWNFRVDWNNEGIKNKWFEKPLTNTIPMPVPSSYNDITQEIEIRDFIGNVWYEKCFFVPASWRNRLVSIYFGSVTHRASVYINGSEVTSHEGGFLPFWGNISDYLNFGGENRITVIVNNVLDAHTLPPGRVIHYTDKKHPPGYSVQQINFDFFNYAGIHRPVKLIATPHEHLDDINISTDIISSDGVVKYELSLTDKSLRTEVCITDPGKNLILKTEGNTGYIRIPNAHFWSVESPFLYTFEVKLFDKKNNLKDSYYLPIGIRTVKISDNTLLLNDKPVYLKGFGMHEDMDIKGKGFDDAMMVKNFNLLKWIGANSVRTSHYPYAEEFINFADQQGMLIIDELPAAGMNSQEPQESLSFNGWDDTKILDNHIKTLEELIARDKNHPSVIMWSIANEAATYARGAEEYFLKLIKRARELDSSRPITVVENSDYDTTRVSQYVDVISINRYFSWYEDPGHLELIEYQLEQDLENWYKRFKKPIIITEYGADAIAGFHSDPPVMFTEEYQREFLNKYHRVFDKFNFIIGEHVWNFADFKTKQTITRVDGNKKGIFTRQRQPKSAAFDLKKRWEKKGKR